MIGSIICACLILWLIFDTYVICNTHETEEIRIWFGERWHDFDRYACNVEVYVGQVLVKNPFGSEWKDITPYCSSKEMCTECIEKYALKTKYPIIESYNKDSN